MSSEPRADDLGRWGGLRRYGTTFRCSAPFRLNRVRRALEPTGVIESETTVGTVQSPPTPPLRSPTLVTFDTEPVRLEYLAIPQLRNRLWRQGPILDGLYTEFADYVSAPLDGRFDVVLVDGRSRERRASSRSSRAPPRARRCALLHERAPAVAAGGLAALQHMVLRAGHSERSGGRVAQRRRRPHASSGMVGSVDAGRRGGFRP